MAEGSNFENVCSFSISATNYPISMKYCTSYPSFDFDSGHKKVTAVTANVAADGRHVKKIVLQLYPSVCNCGFHISLKFDV